MPIVTDWGEDDAHIASSGRRAGGCLRQPGASGEPPPMHPDGWASQLRQLDPGIPNNEVSRLAAMAAEATRQLHDLGCALAQNGVATGSVGHFLTRLIPREPDLQNAKEQSLSSKKRFDCGKPGRADYSEVEPEANPHKYDPRGGTQSLPVGTELPVLKSAMKSAMKRKNPLKNLPGDSAMESAMKSGPKNPPKEELKQEAPVAPRNETREEPEQTFTKPQSCLRSSLKKRKSDDGSTMLQDPPDKEKDQASNKLPGIAGASALKAKAEKLSEETSMVPDKRNSSKESILKDPDKRNSSKESILKDDATGSRKASKESDRKSSKDSDRKSSLRVSMSETSKSEDNGENLESPQIMAQIGRPRRLSGEYNDNMMPKAPPKEGKTKRSKTANLAALERSPTVIISGDSNDGGKLTKTKTLVLGQGDANAQGLTDKAKTAINKSEALFSAVQKIEQDRASISGPSGEVDGQNANAKAEEDAKPQESQPEDGPRPDHPLAELLTAKKIDISVVRERMEDMTLREEELNLDEKISSVRGLPPAVFYAIGIRSPGLLSLVIEFKADARKTYPGPKMWNGIRKGMTAMEAAADRKLHFKGTVLQDRYEAIEDVLKAEEDRLRGWNRGRRATKNMTWQVQPSNGPRQSLHARKSIGLVAQKRRASVAPASDISGRRASIAIAAMHRRPTNLAAMNIPGLSQAAGPSTAGFELGFGKSKSIGSAGGEISFGKSKSMGDVLGAFNSNPLESLGQPTSPKSAPLYPPPDLPVSNTIDDILGNLGGAQGNQESGHADESGFGRKSSRETHFSHATSSGSVDASTSDSGRPSRSESKSDSGRPMLSRLDSQKLGSQHGGSQHGEDVEQFMGLFDPEAFECEDILDEEVIDQNEEEQLEKLAEEELLHMKEEGIEPEEDEDEMISKKSLYSATAGCVCEHIEADPSYQYEFQQKIGEGTFGSVRLAEHKETKTLRAIKTIPKLLLDESGLWQEIEIMRMVDHPNIMRLFCTFEDKKHVYMVTEYCAGGELFDALIKAECGFSEPVAAGIVKQQLAAVVYLHNQKICHRDLKPENFLLSSNEDIAKASVKLIDFGTAKTFGGGEELKTKICTLHYVAPEILCRKETPYSEKCDVWSMGVLIFLILCGVPPFAGDNDIEILKKIKKGRYVFEPDEIWSCISEGAKDLVQKMIVVDANKRLTSEEAMRHDWIASCENIEPVEREVTTQIILKLRSFMAQNRLRKVGMQIIAQHLGDEAIGELRSTFLKLDTGSKGFLEVAKMEETIMSAEVDDGAKKELRQILMTLDSGTGEINYTQFIAATLDRKFCMQEEALRVAFNVFDIDGNGLITREELALVLSGNLEMDEDNQLSVQDAIGNEMAEIERIVDEVDLDGNGEIDFEEFCDMMRGTGRFEASNLNGSTNLKESLKKLQDDSDHESNHDDGRLSALSHCSSKVSCAWSCAGSAPSRTASKELF